MRRGAILSACVLMMMLHAVVARALDCKVAPGYDPKTDTNRLERSLIKDLAHDQACIWTSPIRLRENRNWTLFVPWAGATAALIGTDRAVMGDYHPTTSQINRNRHISDAGLFGVIGAGALMYGVGVFTHNDHARETGWLAGEAVLDGLAVNTAVQRITRRSRPEAATNPGEWFNSGSAFPSDHSMATWAAARVIAQEYPGWMTKTLAYGTALTVSATRVMAEKHSPSDVFVGSAVGFLIGDYVFRSRHPQSLNSDDSALNFWKGHSARSPYLPLDSDLYPIFERLIAKGYIDSAILGQRPWTRRECARLVEEASSAMTANSDPDDYAALQVLSAEFGTDPDSPPDVKLPIESVYARVTGISGEPLRDSYHFGETIVNDFGRPYWEGANAYIGASGAARFGHLTLYARGEYQSANGGPNYSPSTITQIMTKDQTTVALLPDGRDVSRFKVIEGYASLPLANFDFSVGKQALQWGTPPDGGMLFSNNAESLYMLRISQMSPIMLPGFLHWLGLARIDGYFGKLAGHELPRAPYTHGLKLTLKPTKNLELGFSRTVVFAGVGHPLTLKSFGRSFFSVGDNVSTIPGGPNDVGDRRGGFDMAYKLPMLRDWVTVYADMMTDDDPSPLAAPQRSTFNPGVYITRIPGVRKLDLRVEAPTTAQSAISQYQGAFFYYNGGYRDGYTNYGQILGNWVGRQAKAVQATSNYWFTPQNVLQVYYRHATIDPAFISEGGNYSDGRVSYQRVIKSDLTASGSVQRERWNIPVIMPGVQQNTTVSVQLTWRPK